MYLTWYGTASICIKTETAEVITDPFIPLCGSRIPVKEADFNGHDCVLITHGHIDHIGSIPKLCKLKRRKIYCSHTPKKTLISQGVPEEDIREIRAGESFVIRGGVGLQEEEPVADDEVQPEAEAFAEKESAGENTAAQKPVPAGEIRVTAYQGRHVKFDAGLITKTLFNFRMITHAANIVPFIKLNKQCQEAGETLHYLLEAEGKKLFILGSSALAEGVEYPKHCDLLILPYSGRSDICRVELELVRKLEPKAVLIDHYDDTFPPVSSQVDPAEFLEEMKHRGIPVIKPEHKQEILIR